MTPIRKLVELVLTLVPVVMPLKAIAHIQKILTYNKFVKHRQFI